VKIFVDRANLGDINRLHKYDSVLPLSVEVFTTNPDEMLRQIQQFLDDSGTCKQRYIKVPIDWEELRMIREIRRFGGPAELVGR
jgi:hypothetical protein